MQSYWSYEIMSFGFVQVFLAWNKQILKSEQFQIS